jgi:DNA-binding CsgD family transcriptional regulator
LRRKRPDPIGIIEAAYALEPDGQRWLDRLVELAHPSLDQGLGVFGYEYDLRDPGRFMLGARSLQRVQPEVTKDAESFSFGASAEINRALYPRTPSFGTGSQRLGHAMARLPAARQIIRFGMADGLAATCATGDGRGVVLGAVLGPKRRLREQLVATWTRITLHVAAAYRLRTALLGRGALDPIPGAAAILDPSGRVQHAVGSAKPRDAREVLRQAVLRVDRARGKLRREDAARALELWKGLVDAQWTLVDHFDADGRRFVVATKNPFLVNRSLRLTLRERQVAALVAAGHSNKLVAYELGISQGTVASTLSRALQKLGVRSRTELVALAVQRS